MQFIASTCGLGHLTTRDYVLAGSFLLISLALLIEPLVPEIFGHGKTMDYPLWFAVGQRMLQGGPVYLVSPGGRLDFLYTPFVALLLAVPSYFGKTVLVATLACAALASWWSAIWLSNRLAGNEEGVSRWSIAAPAVVTLPFVYDQFHLGQPNLLLLALMLTGCFLLRARHGWLAGLPFATAAAIKVFPIMIVPYLIWRRQWKTLTSMAAFIILFLVVLPATIRGFDRNWAELNSWIHGMLLSSDDQKFSRSDTFSWRNHSLYAVEHRLLRPINAELVSDGSAPPIYVNLANLDQRTVDEVFMATALVIGLGFIGLLPGNRRRNSRSDADEWAIVLILIVIASPVARSYYFVWLLFPYTILCRWLATEPDRKVATALAVAIGFSLLLLAVGINAIKPPYLQAAGNFFWAAIVVALTLAVHMRQADAGARHSSLQRL
jgi:hypothetical protein